MIRWAMFSLNWPSSFGEEDENVKSKQTVGWTDMDRQWKTGDQKSSLQLTVQVSK